MFSYLINWNSIDDVSWLSHKLQLLVVVFTFVTALLAIASFFTQDRVEQLRKPRKLTKDQMNTIKQTLSKETGIINFRSPTTDAEADKYSYQLSCLFGDSGWKVESHLYSFNMSHLSGLAILVNGKSSQKILEQAVFIVNAFSTADVKIKKYQDEKEDLNKITILVCHKYT